jgi:hypothetical protein
LRDAVAVHVAVAAPLAIQAVEVFFAEHLAAAERFFGILKAVAHPVVHAKVEVTQDEHRRLEFLRQV